MKMEMHTTVKTAIAALLLSGGAAMANGVYCPLTGQWLDPGVPCVAPQPPSTVTNQAEYNNWLTNTVTNNMTNDSMSSAQIGDVLNSLKLGDITNTATGGAGGKGGNATSSATGGKGGNANQNQSQSSRNDNRSSARTGNQTVNVDNRSRAAASSAITAQLQGGQMPNCFGDVEVSGSFVASIQTFGWGVSAGSNKASNVCAVAALAGPAAAIGYLQRMDPNVPRSVTVPQPTGRVTCPASHPVYVEGRGCRK